VIRYSTPIVDKNHVTQGILVLSLSADTILDILHEENNRLNNKHSHYHLINHTGEYLSHAFDNKKGGRQSAHDALLTPPALFATLADKPHGTITTNGIITTFQKIYPLRGATSSFKKFPPQSGQKDGQVFWVLVKQTDKNAALTKLPYFQYVFFGAIILVVIVVLIITHWFIKTFVEPLLLVNQHLKALALGKLIEDHIKYHKTNEMGHLVLYVWQLKNSFKNTITQANAIAAGDYSRNVILLSEQDQLGQALSHMTRTLREVTAKNVMQDWLKTGQTQLNEQMSGDQDIAQLTQNIIDFLTNYLQAQIGLLYLVEGDEDYLQQNVRLSLIASYAYTRCQNSANEFRFGEGLVGQAAKEQQSIIVTQVPEDYIHIQSGLGDAVPRNILVVPFMYETVVKGVIEIGSFSELTEIQREFLNLVAPGIGIAINTTQSHTKMQELLQQTQTQSEELQSQAEELQTQQEELRQANEELEERTRELEQQKEEIGHKNIALSKTQQVIETKAKEVELASQYKSEFLANMSHELRTPLNSLLILAQLLIKNKEGNLSNKQVEYARTMHSAGSDLLVLINDILDLSKVEAGKMGINKEDVLLAEIVETIDDKFRPIAINKGLAFHITIAQDVPPVLCTDAQRLKQIINNLLSNAFKFTTEGEIRLEIGQSSSKSPLSQTGDSTLSLQRIGGYLPKTRLEPAKTIAFSVTDSGIGIPEEKQKLIFKAFQQADGTTSRHYGGTGLGLSISRQLAQLLGGEIQLLSEEGKGCTFTLYLPESISDTQKPMSSEVQEIRIPLLSQTYETSRATTSIETVVQAVPSQLKGNNPIEPVPEKSENSEEIVDDRAFLKSEDQSLLIIEDDRQFSRILMELAWEKDFKCIIAEDGKTGLQLAKQYFPNAIILDVGLPQVDGWTVMERLKENPETRHIPVHFISAFDQSMDAKKMGAIGYLHKPVNMEQLEEAFKKIEQFIAKTVKNLLVVVDNELHQQKIVDLVESDEIQTTLAVTLAAALQHLKIAAFDCI
ncbi:MAG TPA: response regulator, partial [Thioploca sp.]|nr:response regulator [Thioploca sp.]